MCRKSIVVLDGLGAKRSMGAGSYFIYLSSSPAVMGRTGSRRKTETWYCIATKPTLTGLAVCKAQEIIQL